MAMMRLQKFMALCGVASRRACETMITEGRVTVDGETVTAMGVQVDDTQAVCVDGRRIAPETEKHYILYHKPAGEVTTASDPEGRATVLDKFKDYPVRLYPVGRLDYDTEGLLLLTNDGDLTEKLLHPSKEVEKTYLARVTGSLSEDEIARLEKGVMIGGRRTSRAKVRVIKPEGNYSDVFVTIHEGRNRQVRKMAEAVGHEVLMLRRVRFGPLTLGDLKRGAWRELTEKELSSLKKT
ncbi:MAG: rRNA pseudouridine synthase [Clostridiales bacterium]|nr:rRNA pseudouridine synthase [Clostridiales bacterium]